MSMSFTDLEQRILDKIDRLEEKLDKTCDTVTKLKQSYELHIENREKAENKRNKRNYLLIGGIGLILTILEMWRSFGSG